MKKRSILAILLAALLALTIFTGCAASTNSMAADSAPQTPGASYNSKSEAAAAEMPIHFIRKAFDTHGIKLGKAFQ